MDYNPWVFKAYSLLICAVLAAACDKGSPKSDNAGPTSPGSGSGAAPVADNGPIDTTPLAGVDISKLGDSNTKTFYKLVGSLTSPCKAESLRKGFTSDTTCKRAPFAVRYVVSLLSDDATESQVREEYDKKYKAPASEAKFDVAKAPHEGPDDAPVKLYEFFDYECPHCKAFKPMLDQLMKDEAGKVVLYSMMFPLEKHEGSKSAAQAALAAANQGKFKEMHELLFDKSPEHDHEHVTEYAKSLGLDVAKFETDYNNALPQVMSDYAQGEKAGVDATPTLFFNNRKYDGPMHPKYIEMWIEEELAVNR
ncbi:MAG: thioredoxin domain-containing protein [Kofleriaceae bacterium]